MKRPARSATGRPRLASQGAIRRALTERLAATLLPALLSTSLALALLLFATPDSGQLPERSASSASPTVGPPPG